MDLMKTQITASRIIDINFSNIKLGNTKKNKKVPIRYGNNALIIQTPFLHVKDSMKSTPHPNIITIETLFEGQSNKKTNEWYLFVEKLETIISEQVIEYGSKWFDDKNVSFKSLIKEHDNTDKDKHDNKKSFIRWPISLTSNIFMDENKSTFDVVNLKERDYIKLIVEIPDLWIEGNQFGLVIIVHKIMVKQYNVKKNDELSIAIDYAFADGSDSESETDEKSNNIISLLATEQNIKRSKENTKSYVPPTINDKLSLLSEDDEELEMELNHNKHQSKTNQLTFENNKGPSYYRIISDTHNPKSIIEKTDTKIIPNKNITPPSKVLRPIKRLNNPKSTFMSDNLTIENN